MKPAAASSSSSGLKEQSGVELNLNFTRKNVVRLTLRLFELLGPQDQSQGPVWARSRQSGYTSVCAASPKYEKMICDMVSLSFLSYVCHKL